VLVDFWAECAVLQDDRAALEELAKDMAGKVTVAKINIDENRKRRAATACADPNPDAVQERQVAATKIGALAKNALYQWVESVI
jgi:thioredoxin 1